MSQETHWEDQMINAAVEALERGADPSAAEPRGDETAETLGRLYTEVLGLIPCELDALPPRAEAKQRLLESILGADAPARVPVELPVFSSDPPAPRPAPQAVPPPASGPIAFPSGPSSYRQPARPQSARRSSGWPAALAAGLLLALAGLSGWLWMAQAGQRQTIASLQRETQEARQREAQARQEADRYKAQFSQLRTTMTLVTAPAALVSPLRPVGRLQPEARGALFVAADHQHWHLSIEGLRPLTPGRVYQLWFVAEQGPPVSGGTFLTTSEERVELSSEAMPPGTKGAMITLEAAGGAQAPRGPEVLRGAAMTQVL